MLGGVGFLSLSLLGLALHVGDSTVRQKLHGHFMGQVEPPPVPDDLDPLQAAALPEPEPEDPEAIPGKIDRIVDSLEQSTRPWSSRMWLPLGFVLAVALVLRRREQLGRHRVGLAIVGLVYVDLWMFGSNYLERVAPEEAGLQSESLTVMGDEVNAWRSTVVDRRQDPSLDGSLMSASLGLLHGTRDVIVTSPLLILRNEALLAAVGLDVGDKGTVKLERLAAHPGIVDLLGLRWLLSVHDLSDLGYSRINDVNQPVGVYENADPLPLGFLVACAKMVDAPFEEVLNLDPKQSAIVESSTQLPDCDNGARAGRVSRIERSPTDIRFETESEKSALLVDNETWYPGWEAEIDGEPASVLRTNLVFRGVELSAGTHAVVLRYRPTWAPLATGLSAVGGIGLLGWGMWRRRRRA